MENYYDFIVIGSGFGGSVAALRLAEKGYSVLVIEKGKKYPSPSFPRTNWNLRKYLWIPKLRCFGFQKLTFFPQVSILSGVGVGGGSLVYANTLFTPPDEFYTHTSWNKFRDWKKTLQPYYEKAGFMLGRIHYDKINVEDEILRLVAKEFNCEKTFNTVHVGVLLDKSKDNTDPYFNGQGPLRNACTECGGCMVGCRENAKNSLDKNYLFFAEKFDACILPETYADKITFQNNEYQVHTKSSTAFFKKSFRIFRSKGLILAGGTLGTMELLLKQKYKYETLTHLSECLGDKVLTNSETLCAVSGIKEKMNNGVAISSVIHPDDHTHIEIVKYPDGSNALKWFFSLSAKGSDKNITRVIRLLAKTFSHPLAFIKTIFNFRWSTGLIIFLVMQHLDNYMKFIWKKTVWGGKMVVRNKGNRKVPAYIEIGQKIMEGYAKHTGGIAQNIILEILFNRPTTAHILGGCAMSDSVHSGVIDDRYRVHGYPDMYVIDGSAIQGNPGVNPSLSILACAEYAMDQIPAKKNHNHHSVASLMNSEIKILNT